MSAQTKFLLETIKSYYNNPMFSDIVLIFNEDKYYLSAQIVKEYAPLLFAEFEALPTPSAPTVFPDSSPEQVLANFTSLVSKAYQKKTLTMADPAISKETLNAVFEFMYGKTLEIASSNVSALYTVGLKFGLKEFTEKCEKAYLCNVSLDTFFVEYQKAQSEKSQLLPILKNYLIENLKYLPLAASYGHLEVLKWARLNGCPWDYSTEQLAKQKWPKFSQTFDCDNNPKDPTHF